MRLFIFLCLFLFSASAFTQELKLNDYDWNVTDITSRGLNKNTLFSQMDVKFIKPGNSICSNRAHMWVHEFKRSYNLNSAKIFLFYTNHRSAYSDKVWWYHVAPVINENGNFWVMDPAFPGFIRSPLTVMGWLEKFAESTNCKEIRAGENELIELIYRERVFPSQTVYGKFDCYYKIVPHTLWTPNTVAMNLLGFDSDGRPVRLERPEIDKNELYSACLEATTSSIGRAFGNNKKKCRQFIQD